jgi:hypothetical protein
MLSRPRRNYATSSPTSSTNTTARLSHWFTQDACERAEEVFWDDETNRPISRAELDLDELLDEDIDRINDLDEAKLHF